MTSGDNERQIATDAIENANAAATSTDTLAWEHLSSAGFINGSYTYAAEGTHGNLNADQARITCSCNCHR